MKDLADRWINHERRRPPAEVNLRVRTTKIGMEMLAEIEEYLETLPFHGLPLSPKLQSVLLLGRT